METFIHKENVERFRKLLERATDEDQRAKIRQLLVEEEAKDVPPKITPPGR
jgi:hypothetical protein